MAGNSIISYNLYGEPEKLKTIKGIYVSLGAYPMARAQIITSRRARPKTEKESKILCNRLALIIIAAVITAAACSTAGAATYYLDPVNGDDSNPGTNDEPWKTLAKAELSVVNGSTVYLRSGNYGEVTINRTNLNRNSWDDGIVYIAQAGQAPVFDRLVIRELENRYLTFEGIDVIAPADSEYGGLVSIQDSSHIKVIGCSISGRFVRNGTSGLTAYGVSIWGSNAPVYDVLIEDCNIMGADKCVDFAYDIRDGMIVRGCTLHKICSEHIHIGNTNKNGEILIEGNHLYDRRKGMGGADGTHGAGVAIRVSNVTVRDNIIRDFAGSGGIRFYGVTGGHEHITIENNLIYDAQGTTNQFFAGMKSDITIKNNTFIGAYTGESGNNKYGTVMTLDAEVEAHGVPNLKIYNNIFVGIVGIKQGMSGWRNYLEQGNNIYWALLDLSDGYEYLDSLPGTGSIIVGSDGDYFEDSGNFFVGGDDFDLYSYTRPPTDDFVLNYYGTYYCSHRQNLNDAYKLASGSDAIGFADPLHATAADLLGNSRDAQPDAGCYEYVSGPPDTSAPPPPENLVATTVSESRINLTWDASSDPESGINHYNIYRDGNKIAQENSTSYSNAGLSDGTSYSYQVTAVNNQGLESVPSNTDEAETLSDTTAPSIESVSASETSVVITFNEPLDESSAEQTGNYSINNGISITTASLNVDTVTLTTSNHSENVEYTLVVDGVKDIAKNPTVDVTQTYQYNNGLVSYWAFDDGSGSSAVDSSGNNYTGTLVNGPVWTSGRLNGGLSFDGVNDYVEIGAADIAPPWTAAFWVNRQDSPNNNAALLESSDCSLKLEQYPSTNKVGFTEYGIADYAFNYEAPVGTWCHLVFVATESQTRLYADGSLVDTISGSVSCPMGQISSSTKPAKGSLDDVRIYNQALSETEVQAIYNEAAEVPITYSLDITALNGSVSKDEDKARYNAGETVTLQATPDSGYYFLNWSGDASGTNNTVNIIMNGDKSVTAGFGQDNIAPAVTSISPDDDETQVPLNNLVQLHLVDNGSGVDADSVNITLNGDLIYTSDTSSYQSATGRCYRLGSNNNYTFVYQTDELFDFDRQMQMIVSARDIAGNQMSSYSWSFKTQMRSFGANKSIAAETGLDRQITATVCDSSGDIWAVWQEGQTGSRNICLAKLVDGADSFNHYVVLTSDSYDQCNADIAIGADGKLYVVWQGDNSGSWDIYISTSTNGSAWSAQRRVTDSDGDEVNPAVAVDGSANAYIVWEDNRNDNGDIYVAASDDGFATSTIWAITSEQSEQSAPAIAVDADDTAYVVWTDQRQGTEDIYGASSDDGPWTNYPVVSHSHNQSSPAIATEDSGSKLHLLWMDDRGSDYDIYYAQTTDGIPASPLDGENIVDDTTDSDQLSPAIAVFGSPGSDLRVFACWQDERDSDTDLYFVQVGSGSGTNVLVGDCGTNSNQDAPAMALDGYGYPYVVWTDDRGDNLDIYYAASTYIDPQALAQQQVSAGSSALVGPSLAHINGLDDVSVSIPAGACEHNVNVKISEMRNMPSFSQCIPVANYDVGPSGITFDEPVTIIIPYNAVEYPDALSPYCYEPQGDTPSQNGISAVQEHQISSAIHAISFQTTHLSQFFLAAGPGTDEPDVTWRFGTYDDQRNAKVDITDGDGNPVALSLRGDGYGEVIQEQDSVSIELHDTSDRTSLVISAKDRNAGGTIGDITINGSLKQISAKGIDLEGDITVAGSLGKVIFNNVSGSIITIGSTSNPRAALSLKLARVTNSSITSQTPISSLIAADWRDTDSTADRITAPSIKALKISGDRRKNVDGDFYADLVLTAAEDSPLKAVISGDLIDSDWSVDGNIRTLVVKGAADNSFVCCSGSILTITLGASYDSDFLAGVEPDLDGPVPVEVADFLTTSAQIKSFTVKGIRTRPGQYYFINSNVSAPSIGRVKLVNLKTQNSGSDFGICVMDTGSGKDLASVTNKSTINNNDSFKLKQGDGIPGNVEDFCMEILGL